MNIGVGSDGADFQSLSSPAYAVSIDSRNTAIFILYNKLN